MSETIEGILSGHEALLEGHFQLSSGRHSGRYLQCALALQHGRTAAELGARIAERASELAERPAVVVSPALGGLIIGHEVGRALEVRACFTERKDGTVSLRRGFTLRDGEPVLLVEDVVTTGLSSREALEVIRAAGGRPIGAACIANRSGLERIDDLPLIALLALDAPTWPAEECPLCAAGGSPVKPGSRGAT